LAMKYAAAAAAGGRFPTASFDEMSAASSAREDFLLVLISSTSGSPTQVKNQNRALTIVEACGVQPEVLDASDPANALVRDELCDMSGIRGRFPQFFLVQGDRTSFFADFAELEHMNEEGTLAEWLGMELPTAKPSALANAKFIRKDQDPRISKSFCIKDQGNVESDMDCDDEYAGSSNTEDLFNVELVSKAMNSVNANDTIPKKQFDQQQQEQQQYDGRGNENDNKNSIILSIPTESIDQEEWSDPMLLERYEDEILALEDYLQEQEEQDEEENQYKKEELQKKTDKALGTQQQGAEFDNAPSDACVYESPILLRPISSHEDRFGLNERKKQGDKKESHQPICKNKSEPFISISSVATTSTITPTSCSSQSRSPNQFRRLGNQANDNSPSHLSLHSQLSHQKNNDKNIPFNVSMETTSPTRSESKQLLEAEIEKLQRKCEALTAERYIMEGQLKEARQKNYENEQHSAATFQQNRGTVHKFQLQQTLRCGYCRSVFKSNPSSIYAPIASQSCGHSICRNCCHKRLSSARRRRDEDTLSSSERLRNTISSDLFMCVDINQVYSGSFEEQQHHQREGESCPLCLAPKAFRHGKLYLNESLCMVLKLLDP